MSKAEILTQLKSAEEQAKQRRAKAEEDARHTVAAARKDASAITESARNKAAADARVKIENATTAVTTEANALRADGEKNASTMKAAAMKNVGGATNYLIKEFERYVDARASKNG